MVEKVKKPIQQLQQLRRLSYNPSQIKQGLNLNPTGKGQNNLEELQLEKVIGTSSKGSNSLQVNPINGDVCYLAGSRLVIYSPRDAKQLKFLASRTSRPFQCVRFSSDGKYLAAGESAFRLPQITIWEIEYEETEQIKVIPSPAPTEVPGNAAPQAGEQEVTLVKKAVSYTEIKHLQGHKYGIEAVVFSPRNDFLISLGDQNDRGLFVWDWRNETKISQNKLSKPALHVEISPDQDFFVTGGYQHLKYWYLNEETGMPDARRPNEKSPPIIQAQSADLTKVKLQVFVGIAIMGPKVFVLASDGHIYVFDKQRKLLKWMNIKVPRAFSCSAQEGRLYCACSDGIIRIFATDTLQHLLSLSKPPPLGSTNLLAGNGRIKISQSKTTKFADVVSCAIDNVNNRAVALYSDRMMFVWDVAELKSVTVLRSMYSHSGPIHDIQVVDNSFQIGYNQKPTSQPRCESEEALTKFVTCSSDRTIRFWNVIDPTIPSQKYQEIYQCLAKNAYCKDMSQMIFVSSAHRESQEDDQKTPFDHFKAGPLDRGEDGQLIDHAEQSGINLNDMVDSIRCIRVSPDGKELASGDEVGNIRINELETESLVQKKFLESHDSEVISLAYSASVPHSGKGEMQTSTGIAKRHLLASGGRDKQILLYDSEKNYEPFMNLDHHASTITAVAFNQYSKASSERLSGQLDYKRHIELISSSADKNLVSKKLDLDRFDILKTDLELAGSDTDNPLFKHGKTQICKDKILSLDVASQAQYMITGHDKSLCLWKLPNFEKVWEKRVATIEKEMANNASQVGNQVQLRVMIDEYASVVVSSSTSKRVTIYEAATGQPLCRAQPGQITTAMCFSNNMRHLITTSDNGLIFVWRLPDRMAQCLQKIKNEGQKLEAAIDRTPSIIEEAEETEEFGDSHGPKTKADEEGKKSKEDGEEDEDFDFDVPDKLKPDRRDNTIVKKRKEQVADVLADIAKATSFVDEIVSKETPRIKTQSSKIESIKVDDEKIAAEEEEDDEAEEITKNKPEYPFQSKSQKSLQEDSSAAQEESKETSADAYGLGKEARGTEHCDETLDEGGSDVEDVTAGEIEGADANPDATEAALWRKIEQQKYQKRYTSYNDDEDEKRMMQIRRSSEYLGRKSISSKLMMRRSTTYVPPMSAANSSIPPDMPKSNTNSSQRTASEQVERPRLFSKIETPNPLSQDASPQDALTSAEQSAKTTADPVSDIIDDSQDILRQKVPLNQNIKEEEKKPEPDQKDKQTKIGNLIQNAPKLDINDFEASLTKQNADAKLPPSPRKPVTAAQQVQPKRERAAWGTNNQVKEEQKKDVLQMDFTGGEQFRGFTEQTGKPIDTRPTMISKQVSADSQTVRDPQQRQRSPVKRFVDKMFGRSPDKKRVGQSAVALVEPQRPQELPMVNVNVDNMFRLNNNYIKGESKTLTSPSAMKSTPNLGNALKNDLSPSLPNVKKTQAAAANSVTVTEESKGGCIEEERKFNTQMQLEIQSINASLARMNSIVQTQKNSTMRAQQSFMESQNPNDISMELKSSQSTVRVHDTVSSQLLKTMTSWNTMIKDLQESTDFDIEKVSMSRQSSQLESQSLMLGNLDSSRITIGQSMAQASQAPTNLSRETIKEDTRDLLDKYSQLLLEQIQAKLAPQIMAQVQQQPTQKSPQQPKPQQ